MSDSTGITKETLHEILEKKIPGGIKFFEAIDVSGDCGNSYEVTIVAEAFKGKRTLQRHRLVNEALKDEIAKLHAFTQTTYTSEEWGEKEKEKEEKEKSL